MRKLDKDWIVLIKYALELGISKEKIREYFQKGGESMVKYSAPSDLKKLQLDKDALEYLISTDTNVKDKEIHQRALKEVEERLKQVEAKIRTYE